MTHAALVSIAHRWLVRRAGCGVAVREFHAVTSTGEVPDAIGWRSGLSILIECKTSRADFHRDKRKAFRQRPETGMGQLRYYLAPEGVLTVDDLPEKWGLLVPRGRQVRRLSGANPAQMYKPCPHRGVSGHNLLLEPNAFAERALMYSALRRLHLRGHLESIYEPASGA